MYKIVKIPRKYCNIYEVFIYRKFLFFSIKKSLDLFISEHEAELFILKHKAKNTNNQLLQCSKCQLAQEVNTINAVHNCTRCKNKIKLNQTGMKNINHISIPLFNSIAITFGSIGLFIFLILSVIEMTCFLKAGKISNLFIELIKEFTSEVQETNFLKQYYLITWDKL